MSPVPSNINLSTPLLGHNPMVTSLLHRSEVIIRSMKDGNGKRTFELGSIVTMSCHPWDSKAKNPPNMISHLFLAQVLPLNHLRTLKFVSQNQRWLQHNPWRNRLVSPKFSSPLLSPSPACPATPRSIIIIDDTPVGSPLPFLLP
ncbi:hypothetical protein O181_087385 [Austropuccinia psidii MF-1]|uniref:Uncharacterized protein n=1 Tax=Austropuccinia psidii MF-1 TaxID=1389203 RepID=A0A9Q3P1S9_9BASI|nr:hypothetical protein [Austropuccinia psidii MF-1]